MRLHFVKGFGPISKRQAREERMVATIAMSGVVTGILAAVLALISGLSVLGVILAYCLTGAVATVLVVGAIALRPAEAADEDEAEALTA